MKPRKSQPKAKALTKVKKGAIPKGWRVLRAGEIIKPGDRWSLDDGKTFKGGPTTVSLGAPGEKYQPFTRNFWSHCKTIRKLKRPCPQLPRP